MVVPSRFLDLVDCVRLCRVNLFRDSRVLGYGRLNGHVASIVSNFFKRGVLKRDLYLQGDERRNLYLRDTDGEKLQEILQRKTFLKQSLPKPFGYVISTRETILFLKYLFRNLNMLINHEESFIYHG